MKLTRSGHDKTKQLTTYLLKVGLKNDQPHMLVIPCLLFNI